MIIINFVLFQVGWFACVLGGAWGYPWVGPAFAAVALIIHLAMSADVVRSLILVLAVTCLGAGLDGWLAHRGVMEFTEGGVFLGSLPLWMIALWAIFATTLEGCMRWLQGRPILGFLLGGCAGPVAYVGGERLGALQLTPDVYWIAIVWALVLPAGAELARQLRGTPPPLTGYPAPPAAGSSPPEPPSAGSSSAK